MAVSDEDFNTVFRPAHSVCYSSETQSKGLHANWVEATAS